MKLHYSSRKYKQLIEWIAYNDEPLERDREVISGFVSTVMLAHVYNLNHLHVADDVLAYRNEPRFLQWIASANGGA